ERAARSANNSAWACQSILAVVLLQTQYRRQEERLKPSYRRLQADVNSPPAPESRQPSLDRFSAPSETPAAAVVGPSSPPDLSRFRTPPDEQAPSRAFRGAARWRAAWPRRESEPHRSSARRRDRAVRGSALHNYGQTPARIRTSARCCTRWPGRHRDAPPIRP